MAFFSRFFESSQIKSQRQSARAAKQLREQAARDLSVEVNILVKYFNAATQFHKKVYLVGNMELAGKFIVALAKSRELLDRIERAGPALEQEIEERIRKLSSNDNFEELTSFELELCDGLNQMKKETNQYVTELGRLNSQASQYLNSNN